MNTLTKIHLHNPTEAVDAQLWLQRHHIESPCVCCRSAIIVGKNATQALLDALLSEFKAGYESITSWDITFWNKCMDYAGEPSAKVVV